MTQTIQIAQFELPTQVSFYELEQNRWLTGIGYRDEIICAECGGIIPLEELYDSEVLAVEPQPIRVFDYWVDFSDFIQ